MQKTLVIHPDDRSTDFLKPIYQDHEDWTIWTKHGEASIPELIEQHDRIVMMGHGSPSGLFDMSRIPTQKKFYSGVQPGFIIGRGLIPLLQTKDLVGIWCNAHMFFINNNLRGFYTGMIISEQGEAYYCQITATKEEVRESNELFALAIRDSITSPDMVTSARLLYNSDTNHVIQYNNGNLHYRAQKHIIHLKK